MTAAAKKATERERNTYRDGSAWQRRTDYGSPIDQPVAGFYRLRLGQGTVAVGVKVFHGPPLDPITGEELDRSWRWQAHADGEPIDFDRVWPACIRNPISEQDYRRFLSRKAWAREHAPDSAYAETGRKVDHLSNNTPLPF